VTCRLAGTHTPTMMGKTQWGLIRAPVEGPSARPRRSSAANDRRIAPSSAGQGGEKGEASLQPIAGNDVAEALN
jgi:hypothetical protein